MATIRPREEQFSLIHDILNDPRRYNVGYAPEAKALIEWHLQTLLTNYPSLSVKYADYTHNDGRTEGMIKLTGTIPILYSQAQYNIPVTIWICEQYPKQAPIIYVAPTSNMIIKDGHPMVDKSGAVHTPYIIQWHTNRSDLVGATVDMANAFSKEPPLYAKSSMPRTPPATKSQIRGYPFGPGYGPTATAYPQVSYPRTDPIIRQQQGPKFGKNPGETSYEHIKREFRETLIRSLTDRIRQSLILYERSLLPDAETEEIHTTLRKNSKHIEDEISRLEQERQRIEQNTLSLACRTDEINKWKSCVPFTEDELSEAQADQVIVTEDAMPEQWLDKQAQDLAVEDCITALDGLFQKEVIALEDYLKQVKKVCRNQYFARALMMKIDETCNGQP